MLPNYQARSPFVHKHATSLSVYGRTYVVLYFDPPYLARSPFVLKHTTSIYIYIYNILIVWRVSCPFKNVWENHSSIEIARGK